MTSTEVNCPTCGKCVIWNAQAQWRPFCSDRCQLIDLGAWADENYQIAGDIVNETDTDKDYST